MGLAPNAHRLAAPVTAAAQSGYWRHSPGMSGYRYAALRYIVMPVLTAAFGYFPSSRLGLVEDLPAGVAREIGHFGFFREGRAPGLRDEVAAWLRTGASGA